MNTKSRPRRRARCRFLRNRRGAAAVEFAFAAPALFLVIFCCFEFARMSMMRNLAQNAAYEAARFVIVDGATSDEALAEAQRILDRLGTSGATISINNGEAIDFSTDEVTVSVEIPLEQNSFLFPQSFVGKSIYSEMTLRTERYTGYYDGGVSDDDDD